MSQGAGAWIGHESVGLAEPVPAREVVRLDPALLAWLRSVAGPPVRTERTGSDEEARTGRPRLADEAQSRGLAEGDLPRIAPEFAPVLRSFAEPEEHRLREGPGQARPPQAGRSGAG